MQGGEQGGCNRKSEPNRCCSQHPAKQQGPEQELFKYRSEKEGPQRPANSSGYREVPREC